MPIVRFLNDENAICYGMSMGDGSALLIEGHILAEYAVTEKQVRIARLLAPLEPVAILGVGLNYHAHALESGMDAPERPVLFAKGINSVQNPGEPIVLPRHLRSDEVDYECELAIVIGKRCKNVSRHNASEFILGYTCANDVSARDWQLRLGGGQWSRGKYFDTFAPLGPCIATTQEIPDPNKLRIRTILNGVVVQDSSTADMIFDVPTIVEFLSGSTTLLPGTVILTGTPQGVGMSATPPRWLMPGDEVTIDIEGIGRLTNPVVEEV